MKTLSLPLSARADVASADVASVVAAVNARSVSILAPRAGGGPVYGLFTRNKRSTEGKEGNHAHMSAAPVINASNAKGVAIGERRVTWVVYMVKLCQARLGTMMVVPRRKTAFGTAMPSSGRRLSNS